MVVFKVKKQGKIQTKMSNMMTAEEKCAKSGQPRYKQLALVDDKIERNWDRKRLADQVYFIMIYHQFRVKDLRQFCKAKRIKIPQSRSRKEEIVKLLWENGADFKEIYQFTNETSPKPPDNAKEVLLTERIQINYTSNFAQLFQLSRKLYNKVNRVVHAGFHQVVLWDVPKVQKAGKWLPYKVVEKELQNSPEYRALPAQTSQGIIHQVDAAWNGFYKAHKAWKKDPAKFRGRPRPPGCKEEDNVLFFTNQQAKIKIDKSSGDTYLHFPKAVKIPPIKVNQVRLDGELYQVRIIPRQGFCIAEIIYKKYISVPRMNSTRVAAIDLGLRNLVCIVNNVHGLRPIVVRGGVVKSINHYYNKQRSSLLKAYSASGIEGTPKRLARLTRKRNNKIEDIFHKLSQVIIDYCRFHDIGVIVIGYNPRWKQNCNMGKRNNQNFVGVPFYRLIQKIQYKAELAGIEVQLVDESHTSKCSFLDDESIEHHDTYIGKRGVYRSQKAGGNGKVSHGLFKTADGRIINADVNGAFNILRNAFPKFSKDGIEGVELVPIAVKFSKKDQDFTSLKQLANLSPPTHALPKATQADGRQMGGVSTGDSSSESIKFYTE